MATQDIKINLSLQQIHDVLCPECRERLIALASQEGARTIAEQGIQDQLRRQLEPCSSNGQQDDGIMKGE